MRHSRRIALLAAVLVLCTCSGCARKHTPSTGLTAKTTSGKGKSAELDLVRVVVYRSALGTGRIEVNLRNRRLDAVSTHLWQDPHIGIGSFQSRISMEEASELRQLVASTRLRSFRPTLAWWQEAAGKPEYRKSHEGERLDWEHPRIRIAWSDKQTVYLMPQPFLGECMCREARKGYDELYRVFAAVDDLAMKHAAASKPTAATKEEIDKLHGELDQASKGALPK